MQRELHPIEHFVCGGVGGTCNVLIGYPFDTIKVRLQTSKEYKSTLDCMTKTFHKEGFHGFYKGITVPLVGYSPCVAMLFLGFGLGKTLFECEREDHRTLRLVAAGALAGIVNSVVVSPIERVKVLLQIQTNKHEKKYNGAIDCVRQLYKKGGARSLFRGFGATIVREIPGNSLYFPTYTYLKEKFMTPGQPTNPLVALFCGGLAGVSNWVVSMPGDILKSRIQISPPGAYPGGLKQVFGELMKHEGVTALFKGLAPALLRAFPAHGATFVGFEVAATVFRKIRE